MSKLSQLARAFHSLRKKGIYAKINGNPWEIYLEKAGDKRLKGFVTISGEMNRIRRKPKSLFILHYSALNEHNYTEVRAQISKELRKHGLYPLDAANQKCEDCPVTKHLILVASLKDYVSFFDAVVCTIESTMNAPIFSKRPERTQVISESDISLLSKLLNSPIEFDTFLTLI